MMVEDFNEHRRKSALSNYNIRKNENNYEYCVVKNYETLFEFENAHSVQLDDVFGQVCILKFAYELDIDSL